MIGPLRIGPLSAGAFNFTAPIPNTPPIIVMTVAWRGRGSYTLTVTVAREASARSLLQRRGRPSRSKELFPPASVRQRRFERRMAAARARAGR